MMIPQSHFDRHREEQRIVQRHREEQYTMHRHCERSAAISKRLLLQNEIAALRSQ